MSEVEGEIVVGKDKFCELEDELSGWLVVGRTLVQKNVPGQIGHGCGGCWCVGRRHQR